MGGVERVEALLGSALACPVDEGLVVLVGRLGDETGALLGFPLTVVVDELTKGRGFKGTADDRVPLWPTARELVVMRRLVLALVAFWLRLGQAT